jgi:hypothetical protein
VSTWYVFGKQIKEIKSKKINADVFTTFVFIIQK